MGFVDLSKYRDIIREREFIRVGGKITKVVGLTVQAEGISGFIGELCHILPRGNKWGPSPKVQAKIVGFEDEKFLLMPLGEIEGVYPASLVYTSGKPFEVKTGDEVRGRVINAIGEPIDGKGPISTLERAVVNTQTVSPLQRQRIREPFQTGVRAIDSLLTCGKGQRVGIFAGSGVGKSTLLGMIAKDSEADVNVIGLIGERGREVRAFLEDNLEEGLEKSVVVVATSDEPPLLRAQGAFTASMIAEYFREKGCKVLLLIDSLTRLAMAQREIGLAIGEPPTTKGYTPSVFSVLPKLIEKSGTSSHQGSITGFYTVLVEGDDMFDPIADATRAILDGHIVLSRELASKGHYPPIDILQSVSRLMSEITEPEHQRAALKIREILAVYEEAKDLINIGAYVQGSNPKIDYAIKWFDTINSFLKQGVNESVTLKDSISSLINLLGD